MKGFDWSIIFLKLLIDLFRKKNLEIYIIIGNIIANLRQRIFDSMVIYSSGY